jgi:hypothetical protein
MENGARSQASKSLLIVCFVLSKVGTDRMDDGRGRSASVGRRVRIFFGRRRRRFRFRRSLRTDC